MIFKSHASGETKLQSANTIPDNPSNPHEARARNKAHAHI